MNHDLVQFIRNVISETTDCLTVSNAIFADGESYWYAQQGFYSITLTVTDSSPYALYSSCYSVMILHSTSPYTFKHEMTLTDNMNVSLPSLQNVPISLESSLSTSSITHVRWFINTKEFSSSASNLTQLESVDGMFTEGDFMLHAYIYTNPMVIPESSLFVLIHVIKSTVGSTEVPTSSPTVVPTSSPTSSPTTSPTVVPTSSSPTSPTSPTVVPTSSPTSPPHIAPTVLPQTDKETTYCGDGQCSSSETCVTCPSDCGLCTPYNCLSQYCSLPSCSCASTHHPTISSLQDRPQFVSITWDDAQTPTTFESMMNIARQTTAKDSFNCSPKMTFFTQIEDNQYQFTKLAYLEGHEIAVHTKKHVLSNDNERTSWEREIVTTRDAISKYSNIPKEEIVGFRAPDLQYNDMMLTVLKEHGFEYDSSIVYDVKTNNPYYPYTLDHGAIEQTWKQQQVTSPHLGLWEVPLPTLVNDQFETITVQNPSGTKDEIVDLLKRNFDLHYNFTRAPFIISLTASWLIQEEQTRTQAIEEVLHYITSKSNIVYASIHDLINYMKTPVTMSELLTSSHQCVSTTALPMSTLCPGHDINTCYYSSRHFQTCEQCPDYYPGEEPVSSTIGTIAPNNQWNGLYSTANEQTWEGGFCMSVIITNPGERAADSFELTLLTNNCQITTLWGMKLKSTEHGKYTIISDRSLRIKPGKDYASAGICGKTNQNYRISGTVVLSAEVL